MIDCNTNKGRLVLAGSVALNIFLVAFVAGRMSVLEMMPPPPPPPPFAQNGGQMPPPPMFGPGDVFSPSEMREDMQAMKANFDKVRQARETFAKKLAAGPVTKEEVLAHFKEVDGIMSSIRSQAQEKMAEKLSSLNDEQRKRIAERMERPRGSRHDGFRGGRFGGMHDRFDRHHGPMERGDLPPLPPGDMPPPEGPQGAPGEAGE